MALIAENQARSVSEPSQPSLLYRPEVRSIIFQVLLVLLCTGFAYWCATNVAENLRRANVASGFGFLDRVSGFDISQTLIDYKNTSTYLTAFTAGFLNTLMVAAVGIVIATVIGFVVGIARLSKNWLISTLASVYVELLRNCPLLLQLFIWYFAVLKSLPGPRQSLNFMDTAFLNVRGLYTPRPVFLPGFEIVFGLFVAGLVGWFLVGRWARARRIATGERTPVPAIGLALTIVPAALVFLLLGRPLHFDYPELKGFNFQGGSVLQPEFVALLAGLSLYTAAFIAEVVRAGILGVHKGQKEASAALGLTPGQSLRLVIIPQAMRIVIPPLTSQYLNLTKNSSLGLAIAYPDLVSVGGTILNQTGQAVEVIFMTMAVYLALSLLTSLFMNWFNARMALVER